MRRLVVTVLLMLHVQFSNADTEILMNNIETDRIKAEPPPPQFNRPRHFYVVFSPPPPPLSPLFLLPPPPPPGS
nr:hypothetical protein Iba_chr05aCG13930 [Ipomoea batatas]